FDGDADRVFLVDETARAISGSLTTAMVARSILAKHPGATILHNLICSKTVPEVIAEGGGTAVRTRVGHSFIKQVMAETGALFGGEHSGHYYFADNFRADSGLIAALVILEALSNHDGGLADLVSSLDRYAASGEINTTVDDAAAVIDHVADVYSAGEQDRMDGLTVDMGDWWFNLRPSNTEPLLRLNLEACGEDGARHVQHTGGVVHHVGRAQPDVDDVDTVFERTVAERLGKRFPFGAHIVTHDHRGLALAGNEAGEGTTDRLGSIGGELVRHRATDVVGLEDRIEIGHWSGSASGVMWGSVSSASSDMPIIGRPASIGRAFAARCG
ncbi:MAG: hypothetical protein EBZ17_03720, partial [Actinobacteria bacterium]|nr:hypothetical protein [Actinomycetota bacterium]